MITPQREQQLQGLWLQLIGDSIGLVLRHIGRGVYRLVEIPLSGADHAFVRAVVWIDSRIEQVAGDLLAGKPVKGQVQVERINHIITVWGDIVILVSVVADRVGVTHQVQPMLCHPLAEVR